MCRDVLMDTQVAVTEVEVEVAVADTAAVVIAAAEVQTSRCLALQHGAVKTHRLETGEKC